MISTSDKVNTKTEPSAFLAPIASLFAFSNDIKSPLGRLLINKVTCSFATGSTSSDNFITLFEVVAVLIKSSILNVSPSLKLTKDDKPSPDLSAFITGALATGAIL